MFKFELHEIVKDKVSGFTGVILGRYEYATGCIQYGVAPLKLSKDGKVQDWESFDESRLASTGKSIENIRSIGGPSPRAPQA